MSYSYRYAHTGEMPTPDQPLVKRAGARFFRRMYQNTRDLFAEIGARGFFMRDTLRAFSEPGTFVPETSETRLHLAREQVGSEDVRGQRAVRRPMCGLGTFFAGRTPS